MQPRKRLNCNCVVECHFQKGCQNDRNHAEQSIILMAMRGLRVAPIRLVRREELCLQFPKTAFLYGVQPWMSMEDVDTKRGRGRKFRKMLL